MPYGVLHREKAKLVLKYKMAYKQSVSKMHNVQKNIGLGKGVKKAKKNKICLNCLKPKSKSTNTLRRAQPEYVNA